MNDQQKFTASYGRDPSMDLSEPDAAADQEQYLEELGKIDPSIPPMPEGDLNDPLSPVARWWCEYFWLPLLAEDAKEEARKIPAIWKALRLIALHRLPPPEWLAAEMLTESFPVVPRKNAASLFIKEIDRFHAVASAIYGVQRAAKSEGVKLGIEKIINYQKNIPEQELASMSEQLRTLLNETEGVLISFRSNCQRNAERMLEMFRRFIEACDRLP